MSAPIAEAADPSDFYDSLLVELERRREEADGAEASFGAGRPMAEPEVIEWLRFTLAGVDSRLAWSKRVLINSTVTLTTLLLGLALALAQVRLKLAMKFVNN